MRFLIVTHGHLPGAFLTKRGHWTNEPFPSVADAEAHARKLAKGAPIEIEHTRARALR